MFGQTHATIINIPPYKYTIRLLLILWFFHTLFFLFMQVSFFLYLPCYPIFSSFSSSYFSPFSIFSPYVLYLPPPNHFLIHFFIDDFLYCLGLRILAILLHMKFIEYHLSFFLGFSTVFPSQPLDDLASNCYDIIPIYVFIFLRDSSVFLLVVSYARCMFLLFSCVYYYTYWMRIPFPLENFLVWVGCRLCS